MQNTEFSMSSLSGLKQVALHGFSFKVTIPRGQDFFNKTKKWSYPGALYNIHFYIIYNFYELLYTICWSRIIQTFGPINSYDFSYLFEVSFCSEIISVIIWSLILDDVVGAYKFPNLNISKHFISSAENWNAPTLNSLQI